MPDQSTPNNVLPAEMLAHYESQNEANRLSSGASQLEFARSQELIKRYLPPPPGVIVDVGGGPGAYSCWLARQGYEVHLVVAVALHVEQAQRASEQQPDHPVASVAVGDARNLEWQDSSIDAVLLFGPMYHFTDRSDRVAALREAHRVLRHNGVLLAVGISRFASVLDGLFRGLLDDPGFASIVARDLAEGQHRNPTNHPRYFTTAFFHHPDELKPEIEDAGLVHEQTLAIEGPGWLLQDFEDHWRDPERRKQLLDAVRSVEAESSLLGASAHMMAVARKDSGTE